MRSMSNIFCELFWTGSCGRPMGPRFFGAPIGALLNEVRIFCCLTGENGSLLQASVVFSSHKNSNEDEELEEQADEVEETLDRALAPDICGDVDLDSC